MNDRQNRGWSREQMAELAATDIPDGSFVNLGIGIPELVAKFVPEGRTFTYHTENGLLGMGPPPEPGDEDPELINAGKKPITLRPGSSFFHHADSFAMVRGGHLDVAILGALQVAQNGDLANWRIGSKGVPAVGGAMDLVHGAARVAVITDHVTKDGKPWLSCLTPAALVEGREVTTIEGLVPAHLAAGGPDATGADPIQEAFDRCGALQCGFCQPGMMLSARALLNEKPAPTREEIKDALAGNLCRCTGYTQIVQAVELAISESVGSAPENPSWSPNENPWKPGSNGKAPASSNGEA